MAIKGLSDRGLSFPEIGQIRKGAPKGDNRPGKDLTFFRVTFDEREVEAERIFRAKYGNEPAEINVILPFDEIERCWDPFLEAYTAGRMVARSDGEKFIYLVDVRSGEVVVKNGEPHTPHRDVVGTYGKRNEQIKCRPVGRLKVIVPELARAAYLTVLTTSTHDIGNISAQLQAFKAINGGRIAGIPLVLRRRPKKISVPKPDGSRARVTKWMLSVEADPAWVKLMLTQTKRLALPGNGLALLPEPAPAALPEPDDEPEMAYSDPGEDEWETEGMLEGEYTEEPEPVSQAAATNGTRPYSPRVLKVPAQNGSSSVAEQPSEEAWMAWYSLADKAGQLGVPVAEPPDSVTVGQLREMYAQLQAKVKAADLEIARMNGQTEEG